MKVKYLKRNIKKQEKFKKRRQNWKKHYYFIQNLCDKMTAMFILYTVDVLPSAKAWRPMAMVYPVSAYV